MRRRIAQIAAASALLLILSGCTLPEFLTGGEENALSAGLTALENLEFRDALASFSLAASQ